VIVEIGVSVVRDPMILDMLVALTRKIPTVAWTVIVEIGVSVMRNPMILDMLVVPTSNIPTVT